MNLAYLRLCGAGGMLLTASACPQPATPTAPPRAPQARAEPLAPVQRSCQATQDVFTTLAWIPRGCEVAAKLCLSCTDIDRATIHLAEHARGHGHGLPIKLAFALSQWSWRVPLLRSTLASAGFAPADLVFVMLPGGTPMWAWPSTCDLETATAAMHDAWGLTLRTTPYGALAIAPAHAKKDGQSPSFPYDVVVWGGSFYAFVPAGRAAAATQLLSAAYAAQGEDLAGTLDELRDAPIQVAVGTGAFIEADATTATRALRVSGDGVQPL